MQRFITIARVLPILLISALVVGPAMTSEDPATLLPENTRWLVRCDITQFTAGEIGAWVRDLAAREPLAARLAALEAMSGLDPLRDIRATILCGPDARRAHGLFYMQGRFERERIETLARAADGHREEPCGQTTIHSFADGNHASFIRDDLLVFARSRAILEQAVAVVEGRRANAAQVGSLPPLTGDGLVAVAVAEDLADLDTGELRTHFLRHVEDLVLSVHQEGADVVGTAEITAANDDAAQQMLEVAEGVRALGMLNRARVPILGRLAESMAVEGAGARVRIVLRQPFADVRQVLEERLVPHLDVEPAAADADTAGSQ